MLHRHNFVLILMCVGMAALWSAPALSQQVIDNGHPTAEQLLDRGLNRFAQGDYYGAQQMLDRVDPAQLSREQRVRLSQTLQDIDRQTRSQVRPDALLAEAAELQRTQQHHQALVLFERVRSHEAATPQQQQQAAAAVAEINRRINEDRTLARRSLDQAQADLQAGRIDEAHRRLQAVQQSDVDLGWWDNQRLERQLAAVSEARQLQEARAQQARDETTTPAPAPVPATAAGDVQAPIQYEPIAQADQPVIEPVRAEAQQHDLLAQVRHLAVQERLATAQTAEAEGNLRLAGRLYQEALSLDPENQQAAAALANVRSTAQQAPPRTVLESELAGINLRNAATVAEFRELMNRAESLRRGRNYTAALEAVQQAKIILDRNQRFLPANQYRALRDESVAVAARIADEQRLAMEQQTREIEAQRLRESDVRRQEAIAQQEQEVQSLLRRAADSRREQNYERSLELLNQALFLDPNNLAAQLMKEMIEDSMLYVRQREVVRRRSLMIARHGVDALEESIPPTELMTYPADWPQLTARRMAQLDQSAGESEINRRVAMNLRQMVPINFDANRLVNVIEYLRNTTNVDFYVNWTALQNVGIEQDLPITLQLSNIPAEQALSLVLQQASAGNELDPIGYSIHNGIVKISTERELTRTTVTLRTYDIRDLLVQVPTFNNAPRFDLASALDSGTSGRSGSGGRGGSGGRSGGSSGSSGSGSSSGGLFGSSTNQTQETVEGISREEQIAEITDLIRSSVGRQEDWVEFGGDVSSLRELNGNLIVRTTPEGQRQIAQLLSDLRETRAMQISVEGRFLLVDQNFLDEVGLDLDIQLDGGSKFGPIKIAQDSMGIAGRPAGTGVAGSFGSETQSPLGDFTPGSGFNSTGRAFDLGVSYLDDIQVNLIVRATQAHRRSINLIAPRITFFNGQRAYITVATQVSYVGDLEVVPNASGFNPTLDVVQAGVVLDVEGTISADRRYVTMTVRPSLATINDIRRIQFVAEVNNNQNNNDDDEPGTRPVMTGTLEAPEIEVTMLETTVSVPDKGTLMLGGQRLVGEVEVEAGVPVLSKVPVLNRLFTNRTKLQDTRTLLILIKPTIIIQTEEEEELFPGLNQDPAQYNITNIVR